MLGLRLPEILVILLIVVVLFGAKRLPELATGIGKGIRNLATFLGAENVPSFWKVVDPFPST